MKVLLTGATGFIGSNIAKKLLKCDCKVYAIYRTTSSFDKCSQIRDKVNWINIDNSDWKDIIKEIKPVQLIHAAWNGIESIDRNNWDVQISNFRLAREYFDLAIECGIKKIIALGSQAEYGNHEQPVNEKSTLMPVDAYGAVKALTAHYLRNLSQESNIEWYWIRIFSLFGEGDKSQWLIPSVINKLLRKEPVKLTVCDQQYDYMYIDDFSDQILSIVRCLENKSGIYNICNSTSIVLKDLLIQIADIIGVSHSLLQFGSIPLRPGQNMLIRGDNRKFKECFSVKDDYHIGLTNGLIKTVGYYRQKIT